MTAREDLINEANELGLEFKKNVKTTKLAEMVAEAKGEPVPIAETPPPSPAVKEEKVEDPAPKEDKYAARKREIAERRAKAFETQVVTLTNKDNRENDHMTTALLSFENQYFGLSKIVPLDVPVELEQGLINVAEETMMTLHKDEIINGKRTGNKVAVRTKKFAISYGQAQKAD